MRYLVITIAMVFTSCGSQEYRLGNPYGDPNLTKKRDNERDKIFERHTKAKKKIAKHYIKQYKSHDGKINLFKRDGFDVGF